MHASQGFSAYVDAQLDGFEACTRRGRSVRTCTLHFESLGPEEEQVYFHADQVRGAACRFAAFRVTRQCQQSMFCC